MNQPMIELPSGRARELPDVRAIATALLRSHSLLSDKIQAALSCDSASAQSALLEAIRFLFLVAGHTNGRLTPSHRVDLTWHEFILFTKAYREFCERHFGRFIDHHPGGSGSENQRQYRLTVHLYSQHFGPPHPDFWGDTNDDTDCGACESVVTEEH
jgi:hypothetical protein